MRVDRCSNSEPVSLMQEFKNEAQRLFGNIWSSEASHLPSDPHLAASLNNLALERYFSVNVWKVYEESLASGDH